MSEPATSGAAVARDPMLDGLRTVAIWLMIMSHLTRRVDKPARTGWNDLSMLVEPLTAALFLFLVGCGLVFSWRNSRADVSTWRWRMVRKAGWLWLIMFVMFAVEHGPNWPESFIATGILALIAWAMLFTIPMVTARRPVIPLALAALLAGALLVFVDPMQTPIRLLNAGRTPWLPGMLFTFCGALVALVLVSPSTRGKLALGLLGLGLLVVPLCFASFEELYRYPLGRDHSWSLMADKGDGFQILGKLVRGEELHSYKSRSFAPSREAFPFILGCMAAIYLALMPLKRPLETRVGRALLSIGRHSLGVYVLHLALIAILVGVFGHGRFIRTPAAALATLLGIAAVCYLFSWGRDLQARRRRQSRPQPAAAASAVERTASAKPTA